MEQCSEGDPANKIFSTFPKRNFVPTAVVTKSGQVLVNTAKQSSPRAATSISTARPAYDWKQVFLTDYQEFDGGFVDLGKVLMEMVWEKFQKATRDNSNILHGGEGLRNSLLGVEQDGFAFFIVKNGILRLISTTNYTLLPSYFQPIQPRAKSGYESPYVDIVGDTDSIAEYESEEAEREPNKHTEKPSMNGSKQK
ncbi:hypothetical protein Tco_0008533 [Tanacetum coccineum]